MVVKQVVNPRHGTSCMPSALAADQPRFQPVPCPHCGEPLKFVRIVYGYPTDKTFERARQGKVVLGGCVRGAPEPKWACSKCHEPVWTALTSDLEFEIVDD